MAEAKKKESHAKTRKREEEKGNGLSSPLSRWSMLPIREAYRFTSKPRGMKAEKGATMPFLPMDQIPIGRVNVLTYEERAAESITSGTYIENGDLLVAKITPSFENGKQAIVKWDRPYGYATTEVIPIQDIEGVSDKHYLFHLLLHPEIRSGLAGKMDGTTGRQRLSKETLGSCLIPFPPLSEQRSIATILGQVQKAIEEQEKLLALTAELKRTLLHQFFTQGLRNEPQKQTDIGPVPKSWEVVPLGDYLTIAQYGSSAKGGETGKYALLRMTNQQYGRIVRNKLQYVDLEKQEYLKFRVANDDILFNRTNSFELVGRTTLFDLDGDYVFASYLIRLRTDAKRLSSHFLNHYFNAEETQRRLKGIATRAVSQSNISATRLRGFSVPLPSIKEQVEIVEALDAVDLKTGGHRRRHATLSALFRTLLHQLMTGQILARSTHE